MFRGPLVLATLLEFAQADCSGCAFDITALEEFSVDWHSVTYTETPASEDSLDTITTGPLSFWSDHGTMALHVRNLQFKFDQHGSFADGMTLGPVPVGGMDLHDELHINGLTGQASYHLASPILNMCFQVDGLPNMAAAEHDNIENGLQQAENVSEGLVQQFGNRVVVDGQEGIGLEDPTGQQPGISVFDDSTHPVLFAGPADPSQRSFYDAMSPEPPEDELEHLGMKIDSYSSSVGSQFSVRACEITTQTSSQTLLAANPKLQQLVAARFAMHQQRMQALLQPLNKQFNILQLADLMMVPSTHCADEELAQTPPEALSTMQAAVFSVCSFVMGVAVTFAVLRKRVTLADDYHPVAA